MQILLLGYKIKNAVQKSTPPEAKNFRDFHSQMQFSLNKLHFPDEKSASFSPAPSAPAKFSPPNPISVGGKMADFGDGGGQAPYAPPMSAPGGMFTFLFCWKEEGVRIAGFWAPGGVRIARFWPESRGVRAERFSGAKRPKTAPKAPF